MALKQYKEAIQDLKMLLKLEPTNKDGKRMLQDATKYVEKSKAVIISSVEEDNKQKVQFKPTTPSLTKIQKVKDKNHVNEQNDIKEDKRQIEEITEKINEIKEKKNSLSNPKLPDWLPIIDQDVAIVKPIIKSPHQRDKTPLKLIPINLTDLSTSNAQNSHKIVMEDSIGKSNNKILNVIKEEKIPDIPPVPINSVQFLLTWRKYKSPLFRYQYLRQLPAENIPKLFQDSMETDTFSEILSVLKTQFLTEKQGVFPYLKYLSEIKRFRTLTMFLGKNEKEGEILQFFFVLRLIF